MQGECKPVSVNVLNGHVETFTAIPIECAIESQNGTAPFSALTTTKVTGNLTAPNWSVHSQNFEHLCKIKFPKTNKKGVDILIGLDHADLHFSYKDVRSHLEEPMTRLTPLR